MNSLKENPSLECEWSILLPFINSSGERSRAISINSNINVAPYPLTRSFLNTYFDNNKFNMANYQTTFFRDCAASMYSYFLMTFGFSPGTGGGGGKPLPAKPGGQGISFGVNPFFGLFDLDSPALWLLLLLGGAIVVRKILD